MSSSRDNMFTELCNHYHNQFFLIIHFRFNFLRQEGRVRQTKFFHPFVHSSNTHNNWGWTRPKPAAQASVQVSHLGGRDPSTWAITCYLPGCALAGSWNKKWSQGLNTDTLIWDADILCSIWTIRPNAYLISFSKFGSSYEHERNMDWLSRDLCYKQILDKDYLSSLFLCFFASNMRETNWVSLLRNPKFYGHLTKIPTWKQIKMGPLDSSWGIGIRKSENAVCELEREVSPGLHKWERRLSRKQCGYSTFGWWQLDSGLFELLILQQRQFCMAPVMAWATSCTGSFREEERKCFLGSLRKPGFWVMTCTMN